MDNDIALIKTASSLQLGQINAAQAKLPRANDDPSSDKDILVTGWGRKSASSATLPSFLQKAEIHVIDRAVCHQFYELSDNMFCAKSQTTAKGPCIGDNGGPAILDGQVVGIYSQTYDCGSTYYPSVFTRLGTQITWIKEKTGLSV